MEINQPKRVLRYKDQDLADLNPTVPMEDILKMHASTQSELATGHLTGPVYEEGKAVYTVETRLGTKG
jgi:PRTRC genetic system protein C